MDILIGALIFFIMIVVTVVIAPTIKIAMDIAPFLYTNTRCSARSGLILDKKMYDSLLGATYIREVYAMLEDTAYSKAVEQGYAFGTVSKMIDKHLFETYDWLENIVPDAIKPVIAALKSKFEIGELKEALDRLSNGEPIGELKHVGNANLRMKLEAATDVQSFATALEGTSYGAIVTGESATTFSTALDLQYYQNVLEVIDTAEDRKAVQPFREYVRRLIDLINIRLALRRITAADEGVAIIEGGFIPAERLIGVSDKNQLAEALQGTPYADIDTDAAGIMLENEFHKFILQEGGKANAKYPLHGGPIVKFLIQKEIETRNLNVIIKLKEEAFPNEEISKLLIM